MNSCTGHPRVSYHRKKRGRRPEDDSGASVSPGRRGGLFEQLVKTGLVYPEGVLVCAERGLVYLSGRIENA
jgi:hypothetical protein